MAPLDFVFGLETRHEVVDVIHFVDTKGIFVAIIDNKGHALCVVDIFHVVHQGAVYRILYSTLEAALAFSVSHTNQTHTAVAHREVHVSEIDVLL